MSIQLHISPRIIPSIASLYNDVNRIFMEYIDNSLDSAEAYYEKEKDSYSKLIEILLIIDGEDYKGGKVIITDNCSGISNFKKVVQSVGSSDKKAQPWTNGQFGYGIYSFMASCSSLEITSKEFNDKALYIPITKKQFEAERQEDVLFPDPKKITDFEHESGTKIVLSKFDKNNWKQINLGELQNEIEKHFELLLARKNLKIKLVRKSNQFFGEKKELIICKPFDYGSYDGEIWEDYVKELKCIKRGKCPDPMKIGLVKPIHIFLKITKGKEINKRPIFICKGRRIGEVKDIKSFRSNHKSELWDHPNITGYIDLSDFLEPTIARNDFKNTYNSKALFNYLVEIEPVILDEIKKINQKSEERHYQALEDRLNDVLSKLARIDSMNYRTDYLSGDKINLKKGGTGQELGGIDGSKDRGDPANKGYEKKDAIGENEGESIGIGGKSGNIPGGEPEGKGASNKEADNPFEDTGFKGGEKKRSGFNIRIEEIDPVVDDKTNEPLRSLLAGNVIVIYKNHQEFQARVKKGRSGEIKITQRLITYLAGEITVHYKDKFHTKHKVEPEYNKNMFSDLVGFVYKFEDMLKNLVDKNLSDLSAA